MDLSVSQFLTFSKCRYKWDYQYNMRLVPNQQNKHLWLGSGVHFALAGHYGQGWSFIKGWGTYTQNFPGKDEEYVELGANMLAHYQIYAAQHDSSFVVLATERPFKIPVNPDVNLVGVIDGVWRLADGTVWLIEHKTHAQMPDQSELQFSPQGVAYMLAAETDPFLKQYKPQGVLFNILRKQVAKDPARIRDGSLSKDKRFAHCSPEMYAVAVRAHGLDMRDYADFISTMPQDSYFSRIPVTYTRPRVLGFAAQIGAMAYAIDKERFYQPDPRQLCAYCEYRPLCELRLWGSEFAPLAQHEYHKALAHGEALPDE